MYLAPSPPPSLPSSQVPLFFVNAVDVCAHSFLRSVLSLHHEPPVSGVCVRLFNRSVCVCVRWRPQPLVLSYLGSSDGTASKRSRLFFAIAEILLTNWMRCKSSQQALDFDVTRRREWTGGGHGAECTSVFALNTKPLCPAPPFHQHMQTCASCKWRRSTSFMALH